MFIKPIKAYKDSQLNKSFNEKSEPYEVTKQRGEQIIKAGYAIEVKKAESVIDEIDKEDEIETTRVEEPVVEKSIVRKRISKRK